MLLSVQNLSKAFCGHAVLDQVSFDMDHGQSFGIIGGSGTGKSVLLKCLLNLIQPDSGQVVWHPNHKGKAPKTSMLFQGGALFDSLPVWENVAFSLIYHEKRSKTEARRLAIRNLESVDLDDWVADLYPAELSGGMQKRVALARALANDPDLLLFDEPTTGLDPIVSSVINRLMVRCVKDFGRSAIVVTHDLASLRMVTHRVGLLVKGSFVWVGDTECLDTVDHPAVHQFTRGLETGPLTD
jgi:phospholipid/cholesterol/gamma-HCH transport system ATP-binding protein